MDQSSSSRCHHDDDDDDGNISASTLVTPSETEIAKACAVVDTKVDLHRIDTKVRDDPPDQIVCFFEHCSNRGGGQTHVQKFCCKFGIILEAIWQYKLS